MKKFTIFITSLLFCITAIFAQAPQKFSYQAVVRNASNALVTNSPVGARISVLQGGVAGTLVYMETHTAVTNENGLMTLSIGSGNLMQGDFAAIDWANGLYYLKSEIDPAGGTNYSITSIQQLLSVPYALYANESGNGFSGDYNDLLNTPTIPSVPTNVSAFANDAGYLTSFTEQQVLSISHDTVFLTGGSFVKLPAGFDGDYNSLTNKPNLFSGNYNDLSNTPTIPTVPTNVSAFNNDAGYITGYTETDPQFNAWDKNYNDLINKPFIPTVPVNVSVFNNDAGYLTSFTEQQVLSISHDTVFLTGGSFVKLPAGFDGDYNSLTNRPSLFSGNYNDLTNRPVIPTVPTNVSAFSNDAGYITGYTETDPQFNAWDKDYNDLINKPTIPTVPANVSAFTNDAGYITNANIPANVSSFTNDAGYITGYTETDPQFNAWDKDYNDLINKPTIPTVPANVSAFTNDADYVTSSQVPAQVNADWNATNGAAQILNKPTLFSGNYNDLTNKPTIPTVPTNVSAFNNDAGYITSANVPTVPANLSAFNNDVGYVTASQIPVQVNADWNATTGAAKILNKPTIPSVPANVSAFANDAGYITSANVPTNVSAFTNDAGYITTVDVQQAANIPTNVSAFNNDAGYLSSYTESQSLANVTAIGNSAGDRQLKDVSDPTESYDAVNLRTLIWMMDSLRSDFQQQLQRQQEQMQQMQDQMQNQIDSLRNVINATPPDTTTQTSQHTISISLTTDDYGNETTWQVIDVSNNTVLASGGPYSSNSVQDIPDVIVDGIGCYVFTIYDEYGDGIYAPGGYAVSYDSVVMGSGYGDSFSQESYLLNPESSSCPSDEITLTSVDINDNQLQGNGFYVKGSVTNRGVSAIHSFKVKYRVDGGAWSSDHTVSCNIAPMGTASFTHDIPTSISTTGQHTLEVVVFEPNGMADNETDNSASKTLTINSIPEGDAQPCPGTPTVTDVDGNVYNTVRIGGQCWMRENLKVTRFPDGTDIFYSATANSTTPCRYYPYNDSSNVLTYGYLYNWAAIMHGTLSSGSTPSEVQGICPDGWHVPSDGEWLQLIDYVSGQNEYRCNGDIAKSLAATTGWNSTPNQCCVGYEPSTNNSTGFSALPASLEGWEAIFGSTTESSSANMWTYDLSFQGRDFSRYSRTKSYGYSIRCLNDGDGSSMLPTVTTNEVNNVTATTAMSGGNVISEGESSITARGVCWSISHNPNVLTALHTTDGNGIGSFSSSITGLASNFTYYVRAYATNMYGTVYGNEVSISIPVNPNGDEKSCPGTPTVTDIDGNVYNTIHIGGQCWMRENLKSTKYADGTPVALGVSSSSTIPYRKYPYNDSTYVSTYGYLYNWPAVMRTAVSSDGTPSGVQGICPSGWHLPSDAEWTQLADYVSSQSEYLCGSGGNRIAKALAAATEWREGWNYCAVGSNVNENNATGFGAMPAGNGSSGYGEDACFWSSTEASEGYVWIRDLDHHLATFDRTKSTSHKYNHYSVRCLRNESSSLLPSVTTGSVNNITATNVICTGNVTSEGGEALSACGICWSTLHNPKVEDNHTSENASVGSFSSSITGLVSNLTYYIRAYATNSFGTVYGEEVSFSIPISTGGDEKSCPGTPTVTDVDGNIYNTILIGDQCWMRENLKTTRFANGTLIYKESPNIVSSSPRRYYPGDASENVINYGYLYNWSAVMHNASSNNAIPSGVQGICPNGWHVPSSAEWAALVDYVGGQAQYWCNSNANSVAKALASSIGWNSSTGLCHVGNDQNANNVTGFGAMPAGEQVWGTGSNAYFWSATEASNSSAWYYRFSANSDSTSVASRDKDDGFSVRCLRD